MSHSAQITEVARIPTLVLAGNATFTLVSKKTGTRFTFRVSQVDEEENGARKELWFVSTLVGSDNNSDFAYTGIITRSYHGVYQFRRTAKSRISETAPSFKAINWFLKLVLVPTTARIDLSQVEYWHEGTCARCGRKLTVPESIESGLGPECAGRVGGGFKAEAANVVKLAGHKTATGWSAKPLPKAKAKVTYDRPFDDSLDGMFGE